MAGSRVNTLAKRTDSLPIALMSYLQSRESTGGSDQNMNSLALGLGDDYCVDMSNRNGSSKSYKIKEFYRKQAYAGVISLDAQTNSWAWKGHVDFNAGLHSMFTNRTFATAVQAEDHLRQSAHQCIDNRLG